MDLTEPLEKLIKVGFGIARDEPVAEIEIELDDDEEDDDEEANDEESNDSGEDVGEVTLSTLDEEEHEV